MSKDKKDEPKFDPTEVAKLPTYQPEKPTAYDRYTEEPSKGDSKDLYRDLKHNS